MEGSGTGSLSHGVVTCEVKVTCHTPESEIEYHEVTGHLWRNEQEEVTGPPNKV